MTMGGGWYFMQNSGRRGGGLPPWWQIVLVVVGVVGGCLLFVWLMAGCAGSSSDCERVRDAVNDRLVACSIPAVLRLDCASADYADGDVEACISAVKAAPCDDVETTYFAKCDLFGQVAR